MNIYSTKLAHKSHSLPKETREMASSKAMGREVWNQHLPLFQKVRKYSKGATSKEHISYCWQKR
jgi:hypothetical protein